MNRKLLFFDIDGTLLPEVDGLIPKSTINAIKKAQELGHYTFINTGRPKSIIPRQLQTMNFDGYLYGCGTHITLHDETLLDKQFDKNLCMSVALHAREEKVPIIFEGNDSCFYDSLSVPNAWGAEIGSQIFRDFSDKLNDLNGYENFQFSKFCIIAETPEILHKMLAPFSDYFEPIERGDAFYEIVPVGFSKASAIDTILKHLNQPLSDCYVFGDSNNDLSMLNHVPNAIAMGNSSNEVLKAASYVTTPVWRDGIYVALKHFGLI